MTDPVFDKPYWDRSDVVVSSSYSLFGARPSFLAVFGKSAPQLPIGSDDGAIGPMDQTIGSNQRAS